MSDESATFNVRFADGSRPAATLRKDAVTIGRLASCDVRLEHAAVSRVHAGISRIDERFYLINLSASNKLTINGRLLRPQESDVIVDGDIVQVGPFAVTISQAADDELELNVSLASSAAVRLSPPAERETAAAPSVDRSDILKVFWEKRKREKDDWGSHLRPTARPQPGKYLINWRPTRDLVRTWRGGLFVWAFVLVAGLALIAYRVYPDSYAPEPLASPHTARSESSRIAVRENRNSCTTCHTADGAPVEQACVSCHQAEGFHASNTFAHEQAGVTCTACHKEHRGAQFDLTASAVASCAECHSDNNHELYNGRGVRTAHGGSFGYPVTGGTWQWKGVYREIAEAIPEIGGSATGDRDEQARLSRQFHSVHVARLTVPNGLKGDSRGLVSCSTCHASFDPIDRVTPRQTCGVCHTTPAATSAGDARFAAGGVNCISCHVQHPFSERRWSEFLTVDALARRREAVSRQIRELNGK
ncbi:MAG: FHA domain-containing protein [Pyrinomonadaceae bacterium]